MKRAGMAKDSSVYRLLEYARVNREFSFEKLLKEFELDRASPKAAEIASSINSGELFSRANPQSIICTPKSVGGDTGLYFSVKDEIRLLEFEKLELARVDSRDAQLNAKKSLNIAIVSIVISILLSVASVFQSYKISNSNINLPTSFKNDIGEIKQVAREALMKVEVDFNSERVAENRLIELMQFSLDSNEEVKEELQVINRKLDELFQKIPSAAVKD